MSDEAVSIVVPVYREAENLPVLVAGVFGAMAGAGLSGEMILVDDDSRDGTSEAVARLAERFPVRLITRTHERGLSTAVVRGFEAAVNPILVCMDADLSHPPDALPALIAPVRSGAADFCIGSRYAPGGTTADDWGLGRWLNSRVATWLALPLVRVHDPMAGFFCTRREVLERARQAGLSPIGYKIGLEILVKAGCRRVMETPIRFADRLHGQSKMTVRQQVEYLRHLWRLYRFRWPIGVPVALLTGAGVVAAAIFARS